MSIRPSRPSGRVVYDEKFVKAAEKANERALERNAEARSNGRRPQR